MIIVATMSRINTIRRGCIPLINGNNRIHATSAIKYALKQITSETTLLDLFIINLFFCDINGSDASQQSF